MKRITLLPLAHALTAVLALACAIPASASPSSTASTSTTAPHAAPVPSGRPSIESFFQHPAFSDAKLSPDGRTLAMVVSIDGGSQKLAVMDVAERQPKIITGFKDAHVANIHWVNNTRLVFSAQDRDTPQGGIRYGNGLFAVNRDGSHFRQLVERSFHIVSNTGSISKRELMQAGTMLLQRVGTPDSEEVFVVRPQYDAKWNVRHVNLYRLNTVTGRSVGITGPDNVVGWLADQNGQPRVAVVKKSYRSTAVYHRAPGAEEWQQLAEFDSFEGKDQFQPRFFDAAGQLYVSANNGKDTTSLYRYDIANRRLGKEPLLSTPGYDFNGGAALRGGVLAGLHVETDGYFTQWFDAGMKKAQQEIDALLPSTSNTLSIGQHQTTPTVLVRAHSDRQPALYFLYNTETKKLERIANSHPEVDPARMGSKDLVRYKARDGLEIPAWLTLPQGLPQKNLPLVVLVHGGPYVRGGHWEWERHAQFLASRGYAVLEPEFRGSTGFGAKHFRAGWKQWGLKMQDDVADGAKWAVAQGIVDQDRICIAGASYGGYATLMGLVNNPELFRCGVNWVGVTDINLMYSVGWGDLSEAYKDYGMPFLVGDREKDAAQLVATSPLEQAARITKPLLLGYGGSDYRVPPIHGEKFRDAVRKTNKDVEWVFYPEEGHGWWLPETNVDFWGRVEKFLERNIGPGKGKAAGGQHGAVSPVAGQPASAKAATTS